jgi:hypothetical protein
MRWITFLIFILLFAGFLLLGCNDQLNVQEDYDTILSQMGYFFSSEKEAIAYFEVQYQKSGDSRDLIDLCLCLENSSEYVDQKVKYYPILFKTAEQVDGKLNGLTANSLNHIFAEYAYISYKEDKAKGKSILLNNSKKVPEKETYYGYFFDHFDRENSWEINDYIIAYEIYGELYSDNDANYNKRDEMGIVIRLYAYANELGYQQEAEDYLERFNKLTDLVIEEELSDDNTETALVLSGNYGYYFDTLNEAIEYFEKEYNNNKDERNLADLSICLSLTDMGQLDDKINKYFPELFNIIDRKRYIIGISIERLDYIYYRYICVPNRELTIFESNLQKYGSKSSSYSRMLTWVIEYLLGNDLDNREKLHIAYDEGVKLLNKINYSEFNDEELSYCLGLAIQLENLVNILGLEIDSNDLFLKTNEIKEYVEELYTN